MGLFTKLKKGPPVKLDELLGNFELPSFPAIVMEVLSSLRDPKVSMGGVAERLEGDPGMQVMVLKTVNSAAFGLSREVSNLQRAVAMMGRSRLEAILLTHAVKGTLPTVNSPDFSMNRFWGSAARRACLARAVARRLHPTTQVEAFTSGLLQDMALPVLIDRKREEYKKILKLWTTQENTWLDLLEKEAFHFDHSVVGGVMAKEWGLPAYLVSAISHHHDRQGRAVVEPGVKLASYLRDTDESNSLKPLLDHADQDFGLDRSLMESLVTGSFQDAEALAETLT